MPRRGGPVPGPLRERPRNPDLEDTVRIATRRFRRRRRVGRWRAVRRVAVVALVLAVLVAAGWLVFFSDYVTAERVEVTGVATVPTARVRDAARVPLGTPLARVDLSSVRARVEAIPAVRSVEVSRSWPHAVRIRVQERTPVGVVERDDALRSVDADGVVFGHYAARPRALPLVQAKGGSGSAALRGAGRVLASLPPVVLHRVDTVRVAGIDDVRLVLRSGLQVVWGSASASAQKAEVLMALMRHAAHGAHEVDVSVPGRPTTR